LAAPGHRAGIRKPSQLQIHALPKDRLYSITSSARAHGCRRVEAERLGGFILSTVSYFVGA